MLSSKPSPSSTEANEIGVEGETAPLLTGPLVAAKAQDDNHQLSQTSNDHPDHPIQYGQAFLLCFTALVEPVAFFTIFPFVNEMLHVKAGVAEKNIGFYAGLIESLFSLVQMAVTAPYAVFADRVGQKPVLVFTLAGLGVSAALFGMAQSLIQMIALRALAGAFGGSVVTTRVMIMENCNKDTQARVFSWYMFSRHLGMLLGPLIGGLLANPAEQFPEIFDGVAFWKMYPYALSTYVAGGIILSAALLSLLFLKETLVRNSNTTASTKTTYSTSELLASPGIPTVLYLHFHVIVLSLAFTAISTVMMYTSIDYGGYGFSDQDIALFLAGTGGGQAVWVLVVFPYLQRRQGTGAVLKLCGVLWPTFMLSFPILNECLRRGWTSSFWVAAPITWAGGSSVAMSLACIQLCLNDISPSPGSFAALNALALTISFGSRAFVPALGTSVYAAGIRSGLLHGHLGFILLTIWGVLLNAVVYRLPEAAAGRPAKIDSEEQGSPDGAIR